MEDRYLFRGKRIDNTQWEYGFFLANNFGIPYISPYPHHSNGLISADCIYPTTLCQCTGRKDNKDVLIFEGDIMRVIKTGAVCSVRFGEYENDYGEVHYGFYLLFNDTGAEVPLSFIKNYKHKVIGNIYDNPELIGDRNDTPKEEAPMPETNEANRICGTCEHNKKNDKRFWQCARCENPESERYSYVTEWFGTCRKRERKDLNA